MTSDNQELRQFLPKKAFEINYAVFRIAAVMKNENFSRLLENQALKLLEAALAEDKTMLCQAVSALDYFIRLGGEVGAINQNHVEIIINEAKNLNSAIAGLFEAKILSDADIKSLFSEFPDANKKQDTVDKEIKMDKWIKGIKVDEDSKGMVFVKKADIGVEGAHLAADAAKDPANDNPAIMRQTAIMERIRQTSICRLKDLQEALSGTSERTIRYDIQELIEAGLVERIGSGGPATFYRAKSEVVEV